MTFDFDDEELRSVLSNDADKDQAKKGLDDIAELLGSLRDSLQKHFNPSESFRLTRDYLVYHMCSGMGADEREEDD